MAVTQYIGARYVPLFAEPYDWDDTREYEPLTIVHSNGNSYTSKQYVPKGIPLTDENYWALTGNYNAQVEQYRKETKTVSDKYDTVVTTSAEALALAHTNEQDIAANDAELAGTADSGLKALITNETERAQNAESSIKRTADANSATVQNLTESVNTLSNTVNTQEPIIAENTEAITKHESQLAGTMESGLSNQISSINSKFPISSSDIADGAVTATKMATSAVNTILQGFTVHRFDNKDNKADNTGMVCPEGGTLSGFYIEELGILVINSFSGTENQGGSKVFSLPTYVPSVAGIVQMSLGGVVTYTSSSAFEHWSGIRYGEGRHIFPNTDMKQKFASLGTTVAYLKPYVTSEKSVSYANAVQNNQIV